MPSIAELFGESFSPEIERTCTSIQQAFGLSADDLYFKIESYHMSLHDPANDIHTSNASTLGGKLVTTQMLEDLRRDLQEQLERRQKTAAAVSSSPVSVTPAKRKLKTAAVHSSPLGNDTFATRKDAGSVLETLNPELRVFDHDRDTVAKPRVTAFMDIKRYQYRTMRQSLLEASEFLDERIEQFTDAVIARLVGNPVTTITAVGSAIKSEPTEYSDGASSLVIGNPAARSHDDVIVVGRIVSDSVHAVDSSKLNLQSVLLETSRRIGSGARVALSFPQQLSSSFSLFPGQIVCLKGSNPGGDEFVVRQFIDLPDLPPAVSQAGILKQHASQSTRIVVAKGPFSTMDDLAFTPLRQLITTAIESRASVLILMGPFVDATHPLMTNPTAAGIAPDVTTPEQIFRACVAQELRRFEHALPASQTLLIPESGVREAIGRHVSFPTPPPSPSSSSLGLPKRAKFLCNPSFFSVNCSVIAVANIDVLMQFAKVECVNRGTGSSSKPMDANTKSVVARGVRSLLSQRSVYPIFPSQAGAPLDVSYLGLADISIAKPDVLIVPSDQKFFAKVVDNVVAINPGPLIKARAAGTYAVVDIGSVDGLDSNEGDNSELVAHKVWERCRVEIKKI
ncbi:DNA polymerase alpha/epsilon subunit B-domain-containing protein [Lipomyces japonicus]|uniref:DNA polymerase alpha/epsilon subunit B-domain-containing protein n=1 Tax=Lipomyces japonicus TaxID=56871 RepID=UPI0034CF885B